MTLCHSLQHFIFFSVHFLPFSCPVSILGSLSRREAPPCSSRDLSCCLWLLSPLFPPLVSQFLSPLFSLPFCLFSSPLSLSLSNTLLLFSAVLVASVAEFYSFSTELVASHACLVIHRTCDIELPDVILYCTIIVCLFMVAPITHSLMPCGAVCCVHDKRVRSSSSAAKVVPLGCNCTCDQSAVACTTDVRSVTAEMQSEIGHIVGG